VKGPPDSFEFLAFGNEAIDKLSHPEMQQAADVHAFRYLQIFMFILILYLPFICLKK
jgi:hypothetical protein